MPFRFLLLNFATLLLLSGCNSSSNQNIPTGPDALSSHIDSSINPGADFFQFAHGAWFKAHPIPESEQSNGIFQLIQDTINAQILQICQSAAALKNEPKGSNKQKIGDFYFSGMDSITLNQRGISDIKPDLDRIEAAPDLNALVLEAAKLHVTTAAPFFNLYVAPDDKISSKNAVLIQQGGLSMPDRSFYFDTDARTAGIRTKFVQHLQNMFAIMGYDAAKAQKAAKQVMALETALAKSSRKREDTRDPIANYHKMAFAQLQSLVPNINWANFTQTMGFTTNIDTVIVGQPEYLAALNTQLKSTPIPVWKAYLKYQLIKGLASYLDDKTYLEYFSFYAAALRGVTQPKPRWKRVVRQTDSGLGELIGQVYVAEYLPKGAKEKLLEIGNAIKTVYAERIKNLDWMSAGTKEKALQKLNAMRMKVGYPDKWKDMSSLEISRDAYARNVMAVAKWSTQFNLNKYGKPVDRSEWDMQPQTYNAYYNPSNNEIVVPGCNIIVPGYERKLADDALLYSIIGGSTFGHEMTHGFDDQGCQYDEYGNLHNWWTPEDSVRFHEKTKKIVAQFNAYVAVDTLHVNGNLTQGENIADLGGVMMGYEAFKKTTQYQKQEKVANLNPDQRFFLGYALAWMINERPESVSNQIKSDPHSPARFRVIGPLSNMPEFFTTFGIKQGDAMWRPENERVQIW
ncbi:MAG: M13 family metallopeptidase [Bacteroidetes bacterium]|nr:M13 family metallopeptidase [Bacteroidota bacterium]